MVLGKQHDIMSRSSHPTSKYVLCFICSFSDSQKRNMAHITEKDVSKFVLRSLFANRAVDP